LVLGILRVNYGCICRFYQEIQIWVNAETELKSFQERTMFSAIIYTYTRNL